MNPRPNALERHRDAAQRAVELNPRSQQAWIAMASYHHLARDLTALRHAVDRVVAVNPLNTDLVAAEYTVLVTARRSHLLRRVLYTAALYPSLGGDVRVELDGVHGAHIAPDGETFAVIKETTAPGPPTSIAATRSALSSWRLRRLS